MLHIQIQTPIQIHIQGEHCIRGAKAWQDSSGGSRRLQIQIQIHIQIQTQIQIQSVYDRMSKGLARLKWWEQKVTNTNTHTNTNTNTVCI